MKGAVDQKGGEVPTGHELEDQAGLVTAQGNVHQQEGLGHKAERRTVTEEPQGTTEVEVEGKVWQHQRRQGRGETDGTETDGRRRQRAD